VVTAAGALDEICLLLVKFKGLNVEQLLSRTIPQNKKAKAGNTFLTITSFFLG
jgi:hypothetical protein